MSKIVVIVGPTASGKSALACDVARQFNGAIVSADSMQIYRGLDVGTAKESATTREEIQHFMLDIVDVNEEFSVAQFKKMATNAIKEIQSLGKLPIVVGGTGLYIEALLFPLSFGNANKDTEIRKSLESELETYGSEVLYEKLKTIDHLTAEKLHPNDTKRIIRALEIFYATGQTKSELKDIEKECAYDVVFVGLNCEREKLYNKVNARVDEMFKSSLLEEIKFLERYPERFNWQSMQAIGYKEFTPFYKEGSKDSRDTAINPNAIVKNAIATQNIATEKSVENERKNDITVNEIANNQGTMAENTRKIEDCSADELEQIKETIKKDTRNYAKRQLTWFRRYSNIVWFDCISERIEALKYIKSQI